MAYRPQANETAEHMVQTLTRALKMYFTDVDQRDWDEYAKRLAFAINTAQDLVRGDTPFYFIHGWDPRTTLKQFISWKVPSYGINIHVNGATTYNDSTNVLILRLTNVSRPRYRIVPIGIMRILTLLL